MASKSNFAISPLRALGRLFAVSCFGAALLSVELPGRAQQASASPAQANPARITAAVDNSVLTTLKGNVHPLAKAKYDQGAAAASLPMKRMLLVLKRGDAQEAALKTFLDQQQDKRSANYHQWLTPEQLGEKYGPNPSDIKTITGWLQSEGFEIGSVAKSGMFVEFSGTAGQVKSAFHTEIHSYLVGGAVRQANATDPQIPAALAPVVAGFASLNNFPRKPANHFVGTFSRDKKTGKVTQVAGKKPGFDYDDQGTELYLLGPYDLATIYNIQALWNAGLDGTGQTIAIVGQTDINLDDANNFRAIFGLPANPPNIITNGIDPGFTGDEGEADIDTQWSAAVAKGATIDFVTSATTETTAGIDLSALYIVDNNLAPVMSESYLACEASLGNSGNQFYYSLWEQAASQGITVLLSAGDSGSANCDYGVDGSDGNQGAQYGLSVSGMSSTPFDLAVGGTDFDEIDNNPDLYWNATNTSTTEASAKGYIPETTWNNSCTNDVFTDVTKTADPLSNCNNSDVTDPSSFAGLQVTGGAGGPSNCSQSSTEACLGGYAKPSWQVGTYNDSVRDTPDISLFASNGFAGTFYVVCEEDVNTPAGTACSLSSADTFQGYGGTSVASPALAGMFSILNQKLGTRVGNANYALYNLAATEGAADCNSTTGPASTCIFNDVTKGTISQPCVSGSPNCYTKAGDTFGVLVSDDGSGYATDDASKYPSDLGWNTAVGYDYATGLGTVNAYNLVEKWTTADFISSATTLALSNTSFAHGTPITANVTVTSTAGTPSGDVSFNGAAANGSVGFATLSGGAATATLNSLPGGSYNVVAHYAGNNNGTSIFAGSDSNPVAVTVTPEASTTTLTSVFYNVTNGNYVAGTTAVYGNYLILPRADVAGVSGNGIPTGTVTISANGAALTGGPFKLNSQGNAEDQNFQGDAGTYALSASYSGDASFNASTGTGTLTITQQAPTGSLTASASNVGSGTSVTLSAVFDTATYVGVAPTGTVTFYVGTTALGTPVPVSAGTDANSFPEATATLATTALPIGTNSITAVYSGDTNYSATTSPAVTVTVGAAATPSIALTPAPTPVTISSPGQGGNSTVSVTPTNYTGTLNLTCVLGTAPSGADATYNPTCTIASTLAVTSASTVATTTASIATTAMTVGALAYPETDRGKRWYAAFGGAALACVFFFGIPARRRGWRSMLGLLVFLVAMAGVGCGGGGGGGGGGGPVIPGTTAGSYTFTVTATDSKTSTITSSATVIVTVE